MNIPFVFNPLGNGGASSSGQFPVSGVRGVFVFSNFGSNTSAWSMSGVALTGGGKMQIWRGGTATVTDVTSGCSQTVYSKGVAVSTNINRSASQVVSSGGTARNNEVKFYGYVSVLSGGRASGNVVSSGGFLHVAGGGVIASTVMSSGADSLIVSSGTIAQLTSLKAGFQTMDVLNSGYADGVDVESGACLCVSSGGTAVSAAVSSGGSMRVSSGGTATEVVLASGANLYMNLHGSDRNTLISGSNESGSFSMSGGAASNVICSSGGSMYVSYGGTAVSTTLKPGSWQSVCIGGTAISTVIGSGSANLYLESGASVFSCVISGASARASAGELAEIAGGLVADGGEVFLPRSAAARGVSAWSGGSVVGLGGSTVSCFAGNGGLVVLRGYGIADGNRVSSGGVEIVESTCSALGTLIHSGGSQQVMRGAFISGTVVESGGTVTVGSSAIVSGLTVSSGGVVGHDRYVSLVYTSDGETVSADTEGSAFCYAYTFSRVFEAGKSAVRCSALSNGTIFISGAGCASFPVIFSGGKLSVWGSGSALDITIHSGGIFDCDLGSAIVTGSGVLLCSSLVAVETVSSGSMADREIAGYENKQFVFPGGTALRTHVSAYGSQVVIGGFASETAVYPRGSMIVLSGGTAADCEVASYGGVIAEHGGNLIDGATLLPYAYCSLSSGATGSTFIISSRASCSVNSSALLDTVHVLSGGSLTVYSGGSAVNVTSDVGAICSGDITYVTP